jgi:hypothetical protein
VLSWSYGEKKKIPSDFISRIENLFEQITPNSQAFIGSADIEFSSFSDGINIDLKNSYIQFNKQVVASIPAIKLNLSVFDLLKGNIKLHEAILNKPQFVVTGNVGAQEFSNSASEDFFGLYNALIYSLFKKIDKNGNSIPVDLIDMKNANFSFNKAGKYETWNIDEANLKFFNLQNTTYLSTYIKTDLFNKKSEVTINARLLEDDKMMLKIDYNNLSSKAVSNFIHGLDWFDSLKPILNGTSSIVIDKSGNATSASLDTEIAFDSSELKDTKIGFKGVMDLVQDESTKILKPNLQAQVKLKDVDMNKIPILWPDKYGKQVRAEVLKNYTKGTFSDVIINFDYKFADAEFTKIESEKFSIEGKITDTDVIYSPDFPAIEKASGNFFYDGDNIQVNLEKGSMGKLDFGKSKIYVSGINNLKTILEISGTAKGDISALKPLLKSALKNRDEKFFYNTRDIKANSDIKFYYKDNINNGFDEDVVKLNIEALLTDVEIKDIIKNVNFSSKNLQMNIDEKGLSLKGDGALNNAPTNLNIFVGFIEENDLGISFTTEVDSKILDNLLSGLNNFVDGQLELEFEYKSKGERNYFAGKVDSIDAAIKFPYLAWEKPKNNFASISFGGKYSPDKAIYVNEFQIVSSEALSTGNFVISLNDDVSDEVYFNKLTLGGNNAEIYFNRSKQFDEDTRKELLSYIIKVNGQSFNASKIIDSFHQLASGNNALLLDISVDKLQMANNIGLNNFSAYVRCGYKKCYEAKALSNLDSGGNFELKYEPKDKSNFEGERNFEFSTNNAGEFIKGLGLSKNISSGFLSVTGNVGKSGPDETNGEILMRDFKLTEAPVLTKLLSLASLTGVLNLLSGEGVEMDKLKGNFKMKDNYLSLTDITSSGSSLGFTLQGNINLKNFNLDLSGAVTPSYSFNSMFGKIPVIGTIFTGNEGEGLIATNYSVKGTYPDIETSVNAFSTLTPGFLRKIWGSAETNIDEKKKEDLHKNNKKKSINFKNRNESVQH